MSDGTDEDEGDLNKMLNSKIDKLKHFFGIAKPEDWCDVDPVHVLAVKDVGKVTLNYIRVILAARGLTLKNDRTPEYWNAHLPNVQILEEMGEHAELNEKRP